MFCHSGLDPESSTFNIFWIPAFAGMTICGLFEGLSISKNLILLNNIIRKRSFRKHELQKHLNIGTAPRVVRNTARLGNDLTT